MTTKFLRKTARRLIRDFDQFQDAYPMLIRSSDPIDNGLDQKVSFSDTDTILFSKNSVSFPSMMPEGMSTLPSSSIIYGTEITAKSIEQRPALPGSSEIAAPFNETIFDLPSTYFNTASIALAPGFDVPARNKVAIPIDITANQEKLLFRLGINETNADPEGLFYGKRSTGFCYYNFELKRWEDIGLKNNSYVSYMGNVSKGGDEKKFDGQNYFMAQFVGTPNVTSPSSTNVSGQMKFSGYDKIGSPTEFFDAPYAPRYHATGSQGVPMSSFVAQPFVLERVDVKLPFVARRKHGPIITGTRAESALRDVDNLVFFIYRQTGNVQDEQSTVRSLIAHESLTFYNSRINLNANYTKHNPVYSYDYDIGLSSTVENTVTGTVTFTMYPKVTSKNFAGTTSYAVYDTGSLTYKRAGIMNFWSGPQEAVFSSSINSVDGDLSSDNNDFWRIKNTTRSRASTDALVFESELNPDAHFLTNYATGSLLPTPKYLVNTEKYSSINWSQYNTPYILLPQDRLVFGLESDICARIPSNGIYGAGADSSPLSVTSSYFKILTDQAQVTLYGSLVQDGSAKRINSLNQHLTSPAVHEIIENTQDDSDQFDIAEKSLYVGTYLDNFVTGTMLAGNRAIAQSIIDGQQITSGSFIRCLQLSDSNAIYYQKGPSKIKIGFPPFTQVFDILYSEPRNPKSYFRFNRYGNHRDMLEQARDYRIFNKTIYKKSGGFEDQGPAYAQFVLSSSETPVSASLTQCNNLSPYMTGTFPFVDDYDGSTSRDSYTTTKNNPFMPITNIFKT